MIDKAKLLGRRLGEGEHEIPGVGTVRIRGLSRQEVIDIQESADPLAVKERRMVALCLVDPALTEDEVKAWQANSRPSEIEDLTVAIRALSAQEEGAGKSGVPGVRE